MLLDVVNDHARGEINRFRTGDEEIPGIPMASSLCFAEFTVVHARCGKNVPVVIQMLPE